MGRLNTAEIDDLNQQLQQVGNVTKIITLVDNIEQNPQAARTAASVSSLPLNAEPDVKTPVAIDPDTAEPSNAS
jgi:hypothetical protein